MYSFVSNTLRAKEVFSTLLAFVLVFSLGLHAIQIHHEHFGGMTSHGEHDHTGKSDDAGFGILEVAMHLFDKKLFLLVALGMIALVAFHDVKQLILKLILSHARRTRESYGRRGNEFRVYDYVTLCFRKGTIHPKAY